MITMITITLPWPDKRLSPNARGAWYAKEGTRKTAREIGAAAVWEAGAVELPDRIQMTAVFHSPRAGRFDLDNALSRLKNYLDGAFAALRRDDADVVRIVLERGRPLKGGKVIITLGGVE